MYFVIHYSHFLVDSSDIQVFSLLYVCVNVMCTIPTCEFPIQIQRILTVEIFYSFFRMTSGRFHT